MAYTLGKHFFMRSIVTRSLHLFAFGGISASRALHVPRLVRVQRPCVSFLSSTTSQGALSVNNSQGVLSNAGYRFCPGNNDSSQNNVLVVGDGDLSYSASISSQLAESGITLVASVLENEEEHQTVYRNSRQHVDTITSSHPSHQVFFETDATQLHESFPPDCFDKIEFNFPHWRGKANNRYNRQLLAGFLDSASQVLKRDGEIHVALRTEQGGARAQDLTDWRLSWQASEFAAEAGLLLSRLDPFQLDYDVSSYRGVDRGFRVGDNPDRYIFAFPNGQTVERELQLCFRHELRIVLQPENLAASTHSAEALLDDDIILELARDLAPQAVHVEVPMKARINPAPGKNTAHDPLLVYLLVYGGESMPLTRVEADNTRERLERAVKEGLGFEIAKAGRLVSKSFPFPVLKTLIRDHSN